MDVVNDIQVLENIEVLETDVKDCNEKCQRVNCSAIYDAIMSSLKLLYHLIQIVILNQLLVYTIFKKDIINLISSVISDISKNAKLKKYVTILFSL